MKKYVFDSYSLITFFEKDNGYEKIIDFFDDSVSNDVIILMNIINWGEVYYIILREQGRKKVELFESSCSKLPIKLFYPDLALIKKASEYKAFNPLSYAACIAAATTKINKGILVTGDREFLRLKDEIKIEWL